MNIRKAMTMRRREFVKGSLAAVATATVLAGCSDKKETAEMEKTPPTFLELAKARFSVRYYSKQQVEQEKIDAILEAAKIAPTAKNQQPFHIYVLKGADAIKRVNEVTRCAYQAPVVFVVCYDKAKAWQNPFDATDNSGVMDATIVGTHMMLEAAEQGLGSCWIKYFDPKALAAVFEIPANLTPSFMLDVGYPAKGTAPNKMHFEKREVNDFTTVR